MEMEGKHGIVAVSMLGGIAIGFMSFKYWFDKKNNSTEKLGPPSRDTRFQLTYVGQVDRLYDQFGPKPFEFNREVVEVFDDMVSRSVPLYEEVIDLILYWVHRYYQPGTKIYDLGSSTGTTLDVIARSMNEKQLVHLVGIDNSEAMVEECRKKLAWAAKAKHGVEVFFDDILNVNIANASFVIMNYTLQFIPVAKRHDVLRRIFNGLVSGGVIFISEKVRSSDAEIQETITWIYENFKERRGYSKTYIARKKDALMNVLIPFTEAELKDALLAVGFDHVEIAVKWNNFTTFVARKSGLVRKIGKKETEISTPHLDSFFDYCPVYLNEYLSPHHIQSLCLERLRCFSDKSGLGASTLESYDNLARLIQELPQFKTSRLITNEDSLIIGDPDELTEPQMQSFREVVTLMKPWKKGPLQLFGIHIDTEWRSNWKWDRIQPHLPSLEGKVVCDLGCGNGYFMYRMLEYKPKLVVGIDPNIHAWLEFKLFQRYAQVENLQFEYLRGDAMPRYESVFDVVFCLGVLYHTNDPIGMLREIHQSMKRGSQLIVDCQGIPGEDPVALFPKKKYANMKGVYFLPTITTLFHWLSRTQFIQPKVIFSEPLSVEEQRITEWAPVNTSLQESLDAKNSNLTIEGYPAPHRFYIRVQRG